MKVIGAVIFASLAVGPLSAQYWSVGSFGNVVFPGLGHAPAGGNPWGNVVHPATPQGAALVPGFRSYGSPSNTNRRNRATSIYAFPAYVGGYGYPSGYAAAPSDPAPVDSPAPQPPVVINQYFGMAPADQQPPSDAGSSNFHYYQAPANNEVAPSEPSYYLIAFKDHTVYSAVAYYTEGDTLHYFTAGNVHNQASLSLVDRALTEQLNRAHNLDVRLPQ